MNQFFYLRNIVLLNVVGILFSLTSSCTKETEHYIRFKNEYPEKLVVAKLDEVSFGPIEYGVTTDYKYVFPGTFPITIETRSGLKGAGTVTLSGNSPGRNNWLVTINKKGEVIGVKE